MGANFQPEVYPYKETGSFRFWCQKVLPLVYDDSLSYYELLCKVVQYLNDVIANVDGLHSDVLSTNEAFKDLQDYVNDYFDNLNVQNEINAKLDAMVVDGTFDELLSPIVATQIGEVVGAQIGDTVASQIGDVVAEQIGEAVAEPTAIATSAWLTEHVDPVGSAVIVDDSLTIEGAAADAEVTGTYISELNSCVNGIKEGAITDTISVGLFTFVRGSINPTTGADDDTGTNRGRTDYIEVPSDSICVCINKSSTSYYTRLFAYDAEHNYLGRFYDAPNNTKYVRIWCQPKDNVELDVDVMRKEVQIYYIRTNNVSTWTFGTVSNNYITVVVMLKHIFELLWIGQ